MSAYKFWRIAVTANLSSTMCAIGQIEMAESAGGENKCVGGVASSSSFSDSYEAAKSFTGNKVLGDMWLSSPTFSNSKALLNCYTGFEYIQYEFSAPTDIKEVRLSYPPPGVSLIFAVHAFIIYASDDGVHFKRIAAYSEQSFSAGETRTYTTEPLTYGQYTNRVFLKLLANKEAEILGGINFSALRCPQLLVANGKIGQLKMTPHTGSKRIAGTTTSLGLPLSRRVDLVEQASGLLVKTIHTGEDGLFEFSEIADTRYSVIGVDSSLEQNSVIFANVTPVD